MPVALPPLRPRRKITGISATLLPFTASGDIDWPGFTAHIQRTAAAGLTPAVNMDTGYGHLLSPADKLAVLDATRAALGGGSFVAGAGVVDAPGAAFDRAAYLREMALITARGGTPVVVQSFGLTGLPDAEVPPAYAALGTAGGPFIGFELGPVFAPFGKIYSLDVFRELLGIRECVGAKHSSLMRQPEWDRLRLRDALRPGFKVFTGNDLAIDMVQYGSDYLLGLSTFAPAEFAARDALWAAGDPAFYQANDVLQELGCFAFRPPVPAYKHAAAMTLKLRGWISHDATHPRSLPRPGSDRAVLRDIVSRLG